MSDRWFVRATSADEEKGPLTTDELRRLLAADQLPGSSLVRREDLETPRRADAVAELRAEPAAGSPDEAGSDPGAAAGDGRQRSRAFRDPTRLGKVVLAGLTICAITDLAAVASGLSQHALIEDLLQGIEKTDAELDANDALYGNIGILQTVAFFATAVVYLVWIHRVSSNQAALGAGRLVYSPGWAVGGWFVPFLNLVRPYQVVREIWGTSSAYAAGGDARRRRSAAASATLVGVWWSCWLVDNALSWAAARTMMAADDLGEIQRATTAMLASDAFAVVSAAAAGLVVYRITAWQGS